MDKIQAEFEGLKKSKNSDNINDVLTLDSLSDLDYLQMCINEGLRFEAPLTRSTALMMTEDIELGAYQLKKG
jgi:cytochrome P450